MRWQRLSLRSVAADEGMWQPALTVRRSFKMFSSVIDLLYSLRYVPCRVPSAMTVLQLRMTAKSVKYCSREASGM